MIEIDNILTKDRQHEFKHFWIFSQIPLVGLIAFLQKSTMNLHQLEIGQHLSRTPLILLVELPNIILMESPIHELPLHVIQEKEHLLSFLHLQLSVHKRKALESI